MPVLDDVPDATWNGVTSAAEDAPTAQQQAGLGPGGVDRRRSGGGTYHGVERRVVDRDQGLVGAVAVLDGDPADPAPGEEQTAVEATRRREARRWISGPPLLLAADVACVAGVSLLTHGLSTYLFIATVATIAMLATFGLYRPRLTRSALDDLPRILAGSLAATAVAVLVWEMATGATVGSREVVVGIGTAVVVAVERAAAYAVIVAWRRTRVARPTLVLGAGVVAGRLGQSILTHPGLGLQLVGYLDDDPMLAPDDLGAPVLGDVTSLADTILDRGVTDVFVAFGTMSSASMVEILRTCDRLSCEIFFVPRLFELHAITRDTDQVDGLPVVRARRATYRSRTWALKRVLDLASASLALLLVSPILALCAVAVRWEGGAGIFFRQTRVGLDGLEFEIIKFRSMRPTTEAESQTLWNVSQDFRIGPVGRFLRKTSLDELPQLFNVLRGDMSMVGPRPERPHFVAQFRAAYPSYTARSRVPAGLTGLAAVNGLRGDTSIEDRARYDNVYIENWSLWLDVTILLRTALAVVRRTGA